ncbi:hypothetical protein BEP19_16830 [Ammoniphilus oxalaticus]|uniref:Uncharacterized protein n=1 Tax=Ammoniphilus oxalaticus TaxID=66863 RepID=A0A419SQA0_9BACL|nr:hypothetical protein [Ammoniphilus oxalaticus]RKD26501.1 hypothetical protein BEP19_16830 [Ammoniphilus oxalaticus]
MLLSRNGVLFLLSFFLVMSLVFNVYSLATQGNVREKYERNIQAINQKLIESDQEKSDLKEKIAFFAAQSPADGEPSTADRDPISTLVVEKNNETEKLNAAKRFMEFTFNRTPENYAEQKKLARNYMTRALFETIYAADGVDEHAQKVSVKLESADIYVGEKNTNEAIVFYKMKNEIRETGYSEVVSDYAKVTFEKEDSAWKVARIQSLDVKEGGL